MVQYYKDVKLADELYPWSTVFDDEHSSISRMYRDLECQHHLVQEHFDERPDIPGLTPLGFQKWVTLLIQARPEDEFERLQKAALGMPINNPDDKKERFPKELSRRLFPGSEDKQMRERIEKAISLHANVDLPLRPNQREASPKVGSHMPGVSDTHMPSRRDSNVNGENVPPPYAPSNIERERKPYSSIPESAIDDTNPTPVPPSNPIERERKPYSAQPGGGKQFEEEHKGREGSKPRADSTSVRPQRSESNARKYRSRRFIITSVLLATPGDVAARHSALIIDVQTVIYAAILLHSNLGHCQRRDLRMKQLDGTRVIGLKGLAGRRMKMRGRTAKVPAAVVMIEGLTAKDRLHLEEVI
ncbi:MAG: hypothetical protein Q9215_005475 [Flavoplaca cf. flavocitrina]